MQTLNLVCEYNPTVLETTGRNGVEICTKAVLSLAENATNHVYRLLAEYVKNNTHVQTENFAAYVANQAVVACDAFLATQAKECRAVSLPHNDAIPEGLQVNVTTAARRILGVSPSAARERTDLVKSIRKAGNVEKMSNNLFPKIALAVTEAA